MPRFISGYTFLNGLKGNLDVQTSNCTLNVKNSSGEIVSTGEKTLSYGEEYTFEIIENPTYVIKNFKINGSDFDYTTPYLFKPESDLSLYLECECVQQTSASEFIFKENTLISYPNNNSINDIVIPKSYSLGEPIAIPGATISNLEEFAMHSIELKDIVISNGDITKTYETGSDLEQILISDFANGGYVISAKADYFWPFQMLGYCVAYPICANGNIFYDYREFRAWLEETQVVEISFAGNLNTFIDGEDFLVKNIADNAFYRSTIESLVMPDTIEEMGTSNVFSYSSNLNFIKLSYNLTNLTSLNYCTSLLKVFVPNSVTTIGSGVLSGVGTSTNHLQLYLPDTITSMGSIANCCDVYFRGELKNWCYIDFPVAGNYRLVIGGNFYLNGNRLDELDFTNTGITKINPHAFSGFQNITKVKTGDLKTIGEYAFFVCGNITDLYISKELEIIDDNTFQSNTKLSSVFFEENSKLYTIGGDAFSRCTSLSSIILPDTLIKLDSHAFYECSNLKYVKMSKNLEYIGRYAFYRTGVNIVELSDVNDWYRTTVYQDYINKQNGTAVSIPGNAATYLKQNYTYYYYKL